MTGSVGGPSVFDGREDPVHPIVTLFEVGVSRPGGVVNVTGRVVETGEGSVYPTRPVLLMGGEWRRCGKSGHGQDRCGLLAPKPLPWFSRR